MSQVQTRRQLKQKLTTESHRNRTYSAIDTKMATAGNVRGDKGSTGLESQKIPTGKSVSNTVSSKVSMSSKTKNSPQTSNVQSKITELEHLSKTDSGVGLFTSPKVNLPGTGLVTGLTPPPFVPPALASGGLLPPLDGEAKHDNSSLVAAINAMHGMIHTFQTEITAKLDDRFSSLKSQIDTLDQRFETQDQFIRELASGAATKADLAGVEATINSVASQVDSRFEIVYSELESVKASLEYYKVDNMRLKHRLYNLEEKMNLGEIKSKRYSLYIDGLLESKDKSQKQLVIEKLNHDADVGLNEADIVAAKRLGKVTKYKKN